jgi:hypothetical protein
LDLFLFSGPTLPLSPPGPNPIPASQASPAPSARFPPKRSVTLLVFFPQKRTREERECPGPPPPRQPPLSSPAPPPSYPLFPNPRSSSFFPLPRAASDLPSLPIFLLCKPPRTPPSRVHHGVAATIHPSMFRGHRRVRLVSLHLLMQVIDPGCPKSSPRPSFPFRF